MYIIIIIKGKVKLNMAKKSFKNNINPAIQFISQDNEDSVKEEVAIISEDVPMKLNPKYIETRSKQVTILTKPSLHKRLKEYAAEEMESVNEIINRAFEEFLDSRNK